MNRHNFSGNFAGATITNVGNSPSKLHRCSRVATLVTCYLVGTMVCGGATCAGKRRSAIPEFNPPPVFTSGTPTLGEIVETTNRSLAVNTLSSNSLTISSTELSQTLSGNFRWERPDNFRLETKLFTRALGTPLAAGSNSNMFWMQMARPTPTIFFARHNEFEYQQGGRHVLPVSPLWLREAFGIVELDPQGQHEGPTVRADGKLEVVSYIPSPRGAYRRTLTVAPTTGTIEETRLYDHSGKLIAVANMSQHQYYSAIDWSLPHQVKIQLLPDFGDPISFTVDVAFYQTNDQAPPNSFAFPDTTGLTTVDLVRLNESLQRDASGNQRENQLGNIEPSYTNSGLGSAVNSGLLSPPQSDPSMPQSTALPENQLPWQVHTHPKAENTRDQSAQTPTAISNPIYRTASQPGVTGWKDSLRR